MIACTRPGCPGHIEDGFCTVCGLAPPPAAPAATVSGAARPSASAAPASASPASASPAPAAPATAPATAEATAQATRSGWTSSRTARPSHSTRRGRLGAGLVEVPVVPARDPAEALMTNPEVAERKRFCGSCDAPVGRARDGRPGRTEGFCPKCGSRYSFTPKLSPGELVGGQYEVLGCLAHGGLGWIYLAKDRNVNGRWVVLKGLLDTGDSEAMAAAVAERRFLAEVEHPNIVKIYNFVQHPDPHDGTSVGYIVMEYVGGRSLKELRSERDAAGQLIPLPIGQAIAYAIEVLPAFGYLHAQGLLYCDFKPDNVIQSEEQLKVIDLGAVRRMDDLDSPMYKTDGYCAPELGTDGPSIESDLYTVARSLAVLAFNFDYVNRYRTSLPDPTEVPVLAEHPSFHRALVRATDPDLNRRFASAELMAEQLTGVLREVLATQDGQPRPGLSMLFSPERQVFGAESEGWPVPLVPATVADALPVPRVAPTDPAADFLATVAALPMAGQIAALSAAPERTPGVRLTMVHALIETGDLAAAEAELAVLDGEDPFDWRVPWYRGLIALATGRADDAYRRFDAVYTMVPGEAATKLALGATAELLGDPAAAVARYRLVWRTDHAYTSAGFGLGRTLLTTGDRKAAIEVLESVPSTSSHHVTAQLAAIRCRTVGRSPTTLTEQDLLAAASRLDALEIDAGRRAALAVEVLRAAHSWLLEGKAGNNTGTGSGQVRILGHPLTERDLRFGMERCYRTLARLADDAATRVELVDLANSVRPVTWW